ncbi:SAM-dependent methyltransferase [Paralimibaculum aggregatum]|uniref:SAM-dependent methyltransferase n=1 Tax=Paralimibaculum aggregatum TaxID=3036245 RepID=A0ABQ6LFC1_9RHOB|nr:SAM-dependent methyltransferase [Limibaculum sp. NKW23]GMG82037.1 SAM-dependent methyltransferase [Limibaculum sp. NKW23]
MPDIHVIGLGIRIGDHATREAERALAASTEVLFVDTGPATRAWLERLCPKVTPLFATSYREDRARRAGYHHMAARVLGAALDHPPVSFAIQGHPFVGVLASGLILRGAAALGLEVAAQPGISAMDCILAELGLDPLLGGLQSYEATDMLLRRRPLQADVPALIWQVGVVESCLHSTRPSRPERFQRLRDHLLAFYPPEHPVTAVFASPHPFVPTERWSFPLGTLAAQAPRLHAGITLHLPAAGVRPIADPALLARLEDPEHLARITR